MALLRHPSWRRQLRYSAAYFSGGLIASPWQYSRGSLLGMAAAVNTLNATRGSGSLNAAGG